MMKVYSGREEELFRDMALHEWDKMEAIRNAPVDFHSSKTQGSTTGLLSHRALKKKQQDLGVQFKPHKFTYPTRASKYAFSGERLTQCKQAQEASFSLESEPELKRSYVGQRILEAGRKGRHFEESPQVRDLLAAAAVSSIFDDDSPANVFHGEQTFMGAGGALTRLPTRAPPVDHRAIALMEAEKQKKKPDSPEMLREQFLDVFFEYPLKRTLEQNETLVLGKARSILNRHRSLVVHAHFEPHGDVKNKQLHEKFRGYGAMHFCVLNSYKDVGKVLLQNYLSLDAKDVNGDTALHLAVKRGNTTMIRYLLENGADMLAQNHLGFTPTHIAVAPGCLLIPEQGQVERMLVESSKFKPSLIMFVQDNNGETLLHHVCKFKDRVQKNKRTPFFMSKQRGRQALDIPDGVGASGNIRQASVGYQEQQPGDCTLRGRHTRCSDCSKRFDSCRS
jgi:hypothetical protein